MQYAYYAAIQDLMAGASGSDIVFISRQQLFQLNFNEIYKKIWKHVIHKNKNDSMQSIQLV